MALIDLDQNPQSGRSPTFHPRVQIGIHRLVVAVFGFLGPGVRDC